METEEDIAIPGPNPLSNQVKGLLYAAAKTLHTELGTKGGATALYWELVHTCLERIKEQNPKDSRGK